MKIELTPEEVTIMKTLVLNRIDELRCDMSDYEESDEEIRTVIRQYKELLKKL